MSFSIVDMAFIVYFFGFLITSFLVYLRVRKITKLTVEEAIKIGFTMGVFWVWFLVGLFYQLFNKKGSQQ